MLETADSFTLATRVDGIALAAERRSAGTLVHAPVDPRVLLVLGSVLDLRDVPCEPLFGRILEIEQRIDALLSHDRDLLVRALAADIRHAPWRAMRGAQALAYERINEADMVLLAGGAGSGKSEAALASMLFQSRNARWLRGTSLEFSAPQRRIAEIVGSTSGRNLQAQTWDLPAPYGWKGGGVHIEFSSMNDPDSQLKLQGRAVDLLVVDDAASGQVTRDQVLFVSRWL